MSKYLFTSEFQSICSDSSGEAAMEVERSPEYKEVKDKEKELIDLISQRLGDRKDLNNLIDCITDFPVMEKMAVYKQAFRDCINLLNWLGLLNLEKE